MADIDPAVMKHQLNKDPDDKPVIQKKWYMSPKWAAVGTVEA